MPKINLQQKFQLFQEHWSPKTIGELNGQAVKIAKVKDEFVWHDHANEDELFMVIKGSLKIYMEEKEDILLNEGEIYIVPKGIKHKPVADEECWILLFEPLQTKHTGETESELTQNKSEWI
jgi:quercetin dioxygenase-like cupin family protein